MPDNKKALSTQSLANAYPQWANTRVDEQSLGFQVLNIIGNRLDDLIKQSIHGRDNLFLPTSIIHDIDLYYQIRLPGDFEFTKEDDDDTELIFTPPEVSGILDDEQIAIAIADNNTIENFWYNAPPTRLDLVTTAGADTLLASGHVYQQPFNPFVTSGILEVPSHLYVTMSGGNQYVRTDDSNLIHRTIVQIEGLTRAGLYVVEELLFLQDETLKTFHEFKEVVISGIRVYGTSNPEDTFIKVTSANFNEPDYELAYQIASTSNKDPMPLFWSIGYNTSGPGRSLDLKKYDQDDIILRSEGYPTKHSILEQELLNVSGVVITPIDIAVESRTNNLWIIDDTNNLYLYSADLPYSENSLLENKNYDAHSIIEPSSYYIMLNQEIELNYVWRRPIQGMVKHRVWVLKPDGTKKSIEEGVEVTYHSDNTSWVFGEPKDRTIRASNIFTLNQRGSWVYTLEVTYADETSSIDKRIITVLSKTARAQYDLTEFIDNTLQGLDFDSENKLWILDTTGTRHQISRHYDLMLIDFVRKILYLKENYDQVRII